jgi:hypothetical protein
MLGWTDAHRRTLVEQRDAPETHADLFVELEENLGR